MITTNIKIGHLLYDNQNRSYLIVSSGITGHQYDRYRYYTVLNENGETLEIEDHRIKGDKIMSFAW